MEFVPGETLQERLRRLNSKGMRLSYPEVARLMANITEAVEYAHRRNMIHRDIKPANIMLDVNGQSILMDFGIAKILGGEQHTATGAVMGTALYMSPEQIRGNHVDHRSDIYSIGVTLFEMLHGRPPFEADSTMSLMMMHLNDPVPDLRQIQSDAPESLVRVIEKCLAKEPAQRYQTAAEITAALKKVFTEQQGAFAAGVTSGVVHVYSPTIRESAPYQQDASGPGVTPQEAGPRPSTGPIDVGTPITGPVATHPQRRKWWVARCLPGSQHCLNHWPAMGWWWKLTGSRIKPGSYADSGCADAPSAFDRVECSDANCGSYPDSSDPDGGNPYRNTDANQHPGSKFTDPDPSGYALRSHHRHHAGG